MPPAPAHQPPRRAVAVPADPRAESVAVRSRDGAIEVQLATGEVYAVPGTYTPRLAAATREQRETIEVIARGRGLHWPLLDEDLSVAGIVRDGRLVSRVVAVVPRYVASSAVPASTLEPRRATAAKRTAKTAAKSDRQVPTAFLPAGAETADPGRRPTRKTTRRR